MDFSKDKWQLVKKRMLEIFKKEIDMKGILFIIGLREQGYSKKNIKKEEKESLMNLAVCKVLSYSGYFRQEGIDKNGFPKWKQEKAFPKLSVKEQETLLKSHIINYFEIEGLIEVQ